MVDHYNTLGIPRTASQEEIKKAFRRLAMENHPDRGGSAEKFHEINNAYEILSDPEKRQQYDNPQQHFNQQIFPGGFSFNFNNFNLNDIFDQAFGQRNQTNAKPTYRTRVTVSLLDVYNGAEQTLQLGTPNGLKIVNIKIPPGIHNGNHIRYDNLIDNATLIIEFSILPDLRFDRKNDDLYSNYSISVLDLITGTKINFETINGKQLEINIPACTQPNQQIKISGYGMIRQDGTRGDQILLLKPFIPVIDKETIDFLKQKTHKEGN